MRKRNTLNTNFIFYQPLVRSFKVKHACFPFSGNVSYKILNVIPIYCNTVFVVSFIKKLSLTKAAYYVPKFDPNLLNKERSCDVLLRCHTNCLSFGRFRLDTLYLIDTHAEFIKVAHYKSML